ncbi:phage antirepressor protein [Fusobacterium gonidiaformans 3-1-5R]|uniref:Phage antirepressor protein n=1 Tax=Fusobacterium gonidiaformans 3-1-5R TaxID=469605 RepID=E5BEQ7_9FUSO|nr:phage antirepressor Ant [Fusobacterium gonidiaformans]EFS20588.1 phage antirepressor protein [Fusobacterium gonidiaformans 3-1-5R]
MNELKMIDERELLGKQFRVYGNFENPLFLAKDVAEWIEHNKPNELIANVDDTEKLKAIISHSGQNREMWFLTEDGLYEVLMLSRKPIAKEFKKEVKKILKTIRKNGMYVVDDLLDNPDLAIQAFTKLKEEREKRKELEIKLEEDKPKVLFADSVSASKTSVLVGELAKLLKQNGIDIGQNRLFEQLRNLGYLIQKKGSSFNMPTQRSMELKLFEIKETTISQPNGEIRIQKTPKVTGKGQQYFINLFLKNKIA